MKLFNNIVYQSQLFLSLIILLLFKDAALIPSIIFLISSPITSFIYLKLKNKRDKVIIEPKVDTIIYDFNEEKEKLNEKKEKEERQKMIEEIQRLTEELILRDNSKTNEEILHDKYKDQKVVDLESYKKDLYKNYDLYESKLRIRNSLTTCIQNDKVFYPDVKDDDYTIIFDIIYKYFVIENKTDLYYQAMLSLTRSTLFYNDEINEINVENYSKVLRIELLPYLNIENIKLIESELEKYKYEKYLDENNLENNQKVLYLDYFRKK